MFKHRINRAIPNDNSDYQLQSQHRGTALFLPSNELTSEHCRFQEYVYMTLPASSPHVEPSQVSRAILLDVSVRPITVSFLVMVLTNFHSKRDSSLAALRPGPHPSPSSVRNIQSPQT